MDYLSEPIDYIERTKTLYGSLNYPAYEWVKEGATALSKLTKPVSQCKAGLICSGGIYKKGQIAFHYKDDFSYRIIDTETEPEDLRITHFAYDLEDAREDANVVFPVGTLKELVSGDFLGELAHDAYSFMGGIYSSKRVREVLAPALADQMQKNQVDLAVLVPA